MKTLEVYVAAFIDPISSGRTCGQLFGVGKKIYRERPHFKQKMESEIKSEEQQQRSVPQMSDYCLPWLSILWTFFLCSVPMNIN